MYNHVLYLFYWIATGLIIYLSNLLFPDFVVLGNAKYGAIESAIYSGFWVTFFLWLMWDFVIARGARLNEPVASNLFFWAVNSAGIWLVARMSHITGLGIKNFLWVLILAVVSDIIQKFIWRFLVAQPGTRARK